jgi:hypothetical protein
MGKFPFQAELEQRKWSCEKELQVEAMDVYLTCACRSYLKGWATQETNWTGANTTHYSWGRGYTRDEAWEFGITSMVG